MSSNLKLNQVFISNAFKSSAFKFSKTLLIKVCFLGSIAPNAVLAEETYWHYKFKKGDNLINVAKKHLLNKNNWQVVQKLNHISNPHAVPVGFPIKVPLTMVKLLPASATLILIQGDVKVGKASVEAVVYEPAKLMVQLHLGDSIKTGERSLAVIQFADGSLLNLQSSAALVLDNLQAYSGSRQANTQVKLKQGRVQVNANPEHLDGHKFEVITPNAIAAVRGTVFRVGADEDTLATTQETLEGRVGLANTLSTVDVNQGYGATATAGQPPLAPVPLLPALDTTHLPKTWQELPVQFQFPTQAGATAWHVRLVNEQAILEDDLLTSEPRYTAKSLRDGQYQLVVTALDSNKIEGYEAIHAFVVAATPLPPQLLQPEQGLVVRHSPLVLRWQQTAAARQSVLELAKDAGFAHLADKQVVADNQFQLRLTEPAKYYWRLASIENNKQGPYSPSQSFEYKPLPKAPNLQDFKIETLGNRLSVTYLGQQAVHNLNLQLKHPQFPEVAESKVTISADTLNIKPQTVLELREYGKQRLLLSWQEDGQTLSDTTVFDFSATNPYAK